MTKPEDTPEFIRLKKVILAIIDERDVERDLPKILVTLEQVIAATLVHLTNHDHRLAAVILNEGLLHQVEKRISFSHAKAIERARGQSI